MDVVRAGRGPQYSPAPPPGVSLDGEEEPVWETQQASKAAVELHHKNLADDEEDVCRICQFPGNESPLYYPCACKGSMKYVHELCLLRWLNRNGGARQFCEICRQAIAFSPVYAQNAPSKLPFPELLLGMVLKAARDMRFPMGLTFILSVTILFVPIGTSLDLTGLYLCQMTPVVIGSWWLLFEQARADGFENLPTMWVLKEIIAAILIRLLFALCVPQVFSLWIFRSLGYSPIVNSFVNRFAGLSYLGVVMSWYGMKELRHSSWVWDLHNSIKDERYLVSRRLHNFRETKRNGLSATPNVKL